MQEEWHRGERKCTFVIPARNLLLLDLDIINNDRPSIAVASPLHILRPSRCRRAVNHLCPCAVHHHCCCRITVVPSIAVAVAPSIAVVAIALPLCHSLSSLHAFHCLCFRRVAIAPSIAVHHRRRCVAIPPLHRHHRCCRCCRYRCHHHSPLLPIPSLVG